MKILVWCSAVSIGGGARLLTNLLLAMAGQPEVTFLYLVIHPMSRIKERIPPSRAAKIRIFYTDELADAPLRAIAADFDLVYCFWPHGLDYQDAGKPMICTFHDTTLFDHPPQFLSGAALRHAWEQSRTWLDSCSRVVVPSNHAKSRLIANFGACCHRAAVIPYTLSPTTAFAAADLSPDIAARTPADYIIYPANTALHKNHYNLLLAYARFSRRQQCPLVLCGYQTEKLALQPPDWPNETPFPTLVSLIKHLGLKADKDFFPLGYIGDSDVNLLIRNAKALIMPSLSEAGGGLTVEESLALGTPVLCSDIPVTRELLAGRTAKIGWFDPYSPAAIAAALEDLFANYDAYKTTAVAGSQDPRPSWNDVARQYIAIFRAAVGTGR